MNKSIFFLFWFSISNFFGYKYANSQEVIPYEYQFPKMDDIVLSPLKVELEKKIGCLFFIQNNNLSGSKNISVYFLNNHHELSKVYEIYHFNENDKLLGAFIYHDKYDNDYVYILTKLGDNSSLAYQFHELSLLIENDELKVLFFYGDAVASAHDSLCVENLEKEKKCEFSTIEGLKDFLDKR